MKNDIQEMIKRILTFNFAARDCDLTLVEAVYEEIKPGSTHMRYAHVNGLIKLKALPSMKSVSRTRRTLQELHPITRGHVYELRHDKANEMRKSIKIEPQLALKIL